MMKKNEYKAPRLEEISLRTEQVLDTSFPELPDHDWVKSGGVQVFPEET